MLEIHAEDEQATSVLLFAAAALVEAPTAPSALIQSVINRLIACLTSANPTFAYEVAEQAVSLVKKVPDLFTSLLRPLFEHSQQWTRFSALYLALESKVSMIDVDELEALLDFLTTEDLLPDKRKTAYTHQGKAISSVGWDFQNKMLVLVAETLAHIRPDARTKGLLQTLYDCSDIVGLGIQRFELRHILLGLGCNEFIEERDRRDDGGLKSSILLLREELADAHRKILEAILRQTTPSYTAAKKRSKMRALAILLYALRIPEAAVQDLLILRQLDNVQGIEAVLSGYIAALRLDKKELAQDATWALAELQKMNQDGIVGGSLSSLLPKFPISPEIHQIDSLGIAVAEIVRALLHPSLIIAYGAAQLLSAAREGREDVAALLFSSSDERLLGILAIIAGRLWEAEARPLLMKRLDQGYTPGSWWLIEALPSLPGEHTDPLFQQTILHALQAEDPRVTIAATHALQELDIALVRGMAPALQSALLYWREQGESAKTRSSYVAGDCPTCRTEPGNAYAHVSHLTDRL